MNYMFTCFNMNLFQHTPACYLNMNEMIINGSEMNSIVSMKILYFHRPNKNSKLQYPLRFHQIGYQYIFRNKFQGVTYIDPVARDQERLKYCDDAF